jgi:hypothetical protein
MAGEMEKTNGHLEKYYKAQRIVPSGEWAAFLVCLQKPLPAVIRITKRRSLYKSIRDEMRPQGISPRETPKHVTQTMPQHHPFNPRVQAGHASHGILTSLYGNAIVIGPHHCKALCLSPSLCRSHEHHHHHHHGLSFCPLACFVTLPSNDEKRSVQVQCRGNGPQVEQRAARCHAAFSRSRINDTSPVFGSPS